MPQATTKLVVIRAGHHRALVPLQHVGETMRPLPIHALSTPLPFVLGMSVIRGTSIPVVDLGAMLGRTSEESNPFQRFLSLELGGRSVALAVDTVERVVEFPVEHFDALPPLLAQAADEVVESFLLADADLHLLLRSTKLFDVAAPLMEAPP